MSEFTAGFVTRLHGKIGDDDLRTVSDELETYVDKWNIEHKSTALILPEDSIPHEYKEYVVSMKLEGLSDQTIRCYNQTMVAFFLTIGLPVREITTAVIKRYLITYSQQTHGSCKRKPGPHTMDNMRIQIHAFMDWCLDNEYIDKNPCRPIKPFRYQKKPVDTISRMQLERIKAACRTEREKAIICTMYITAVRVGEFVSIKKQDIRWSDANRHGIVPVSIVGKGGKHRTVYLDAEANVALRRYLDSRTDKCEYAFVSERAPHNRLTTRAVQMLIQRIGKDAGIEGLHPHELRHTRATDFCRESGSIVLAQKLLGHTSINTTQAYYVVTGQEELENEISRYS